MSLNPSQQRAVDSAGHVLIVACPGSGKTHTLVERSARLLKERSDVRLGIVTFGRAAADELKARVVAKMGSQILPRIDSGTFHSLCLQQLEVLSANGRRPFGLAVEAHTAVLVHKAWQEVRRTNRRSVITQEQVKRGIDYAKANRGLIPDDAHATDIKAALDIYQSQLQAQSLLDFSDIIELTVRGMQSGQLPPLGVTDLLVDEFQDADPTQVDWVLAHVAVGVRVTVVGDDDQSIFGFRHAAGYSGLMTFAQRTRAETITLDTTYRCCRDVVVHASRLIAHNSERVRKTIRTANAITGTVDRQDFGSFTEEVEALAQQLYERPAGESAAVLTRTNELLRVIQTYMDAREMPYRGGVDGSIWSGGAPGLIRGLIGAAVGKDLSGITMALSARGMNYEANIAAREAITAAKGSFDALLGKERWTHGLNDRQVSIWNDARADYAHLASAARGPAMEFVRIAIKFIAPGVDGIANPKLLEKIEQILSRLPESLPEMYRALEQFIRQAGKGTSIEDTQATMLMTLHASKGLEFDRVWMPAMRQGVLPSAKTSDVAEERRLCYVGMTRARQRLTLSYSPRADHPPSVFLTEMGLGLPEVRARAQR